MNNKNGISLVVTLIIIAAVGALSVLGALLYMSYENRVDDMQRDQDIIADGEEGEQLSAFTAYCIEGLDKEPISITDGGSRPWLTSEEIKDICLQADIIKQKDGEELGLAIMLICKDFSKEEITVVVQGTSKDVPLTASPAEICALGLMGTFQEYKLE